MALLLTLALTLPSPVLSEVEGPASALREPQTSEKSGATLSGLEEALNGEAAGREPEEEGPPDQAFDRQLAQLLRQGAPEDRARAASLVAEKYAGYAAQVAEDWYARARYFSEVIARAPFPYELEREDAAQEAALALRDLTRRWQQEPPKSDTLGTPIYVRVKQSVTDQLSKRWGASRGLIEQALVALHNAIREPRGGAADQIRLSDEQVRAHLRGNEAVRTLAKQLLKEAPVSRDSFAGLPASETGVDIRMDQEELRENLRPILDRLPPRRREMLKLSFQIVESRLYSTAEVAGMMGISERQVEEVRRKALRALRLPHVHIGRVDPAALSERLAERGPELLTARERQILRWTFGLPNEDREYTLEEIGEAFHVSPELVRQTVAKVIRALQMPDEPRWLLSAMSEQEMEEAARRHLWSFPLREREILRLRFRMAGHNPYTRDQVAEILQIDPGRVSANETRARRLLADAPGEDQQTLQEFLQERGEELLSARQRQLLRWLEGLPPEQALSEQEIGQIFGVSRSGVQRVIEDVARLSGRRLQDQVNRVEPFAGQWVGRAVEERAWEQPAPAFFRPRASVRKEVPIRRGPLSEEEEEALLAWVNALSPGQRRILPELLEGLGPDGRTAPSADAIAQKLGLSASRIGPNRDRLVRKLRVAFTLGGFDRFGSFKRVVGRLIFLAGETRLERLFRRANLDALLEVSRGDSDMVREALMQLFPGEFKEKELRELIGQHFRELFAQLRPGAPRRISARQVLQPVHRLVAYLRTAREAAEAERRRLVLKRLIRDLYFAVIEQDEEEGTTRGITTLASEIEREGDPFWRGLLQETLDFYSGGTSFQVRGFREEVAPDAVEPMLLVQRLMTYEAVQSLQGPDRGALLASEPRTMKTIPAVLAAYNVRAPPGEPPVRRVLYTTSNQAKYEVAEELKRRTNEELGLTVVVVDAEDVEHGDRKAQIERASTLPGNVVLIANYESVKDYPEEIGAFRPDAHVIDEIENLRHGDETIRAPIIFGIPARYRIGVSARLVVNDPADTLEPLLWTRSAAFAPPQEGRGRILAMSPDELFAALEPVVLIGTYSLLSASLNLYQLPGRPFHNSTLVGLHESWMRMDDKERLTGIGQTYRVKAYRLLSEFPSSEENTPDLILHERHGGQQELFVRVLDGRPVLDESSQAQLAELARLVSTRPAAEPAAASFASGLEEKRKTAEGLGDLIRNVGAILETERVRGAGQLKPRIEQIQSREFFTEHHVTYLPATQGRLEVIGDLHGDLEALERALAQAGYDPHRNAGLPPEQRVHLLFVGDYADVGTHSVEVAARVLLLKATDPRHVVLLGGNHDRDRPTHQSANVQMHPIRWFFKELEEILGPVDGDQLYGEFHRLMTDLPVLAVFSNGIVIGHAEGPSLADPPPEYPEKFRAKFDPELGLLNLANPLMVDQLGWNPVRRPPDGQPEAEEDQIVDGTKHPRIDPSTMQPGYWIGRKSHFGFLNSIGGKVFLRGHDRLGPADQVLFDGTFLTVITTDYRSPDHGYDPKEKITGRYAEFDLARTYDTIDPDEVVRYLLWPPTGHGLASYYADLFRNAPGVIPYPIKREGGTYIFRTVDHLVEFRVAGDRLEVRTNGIEGYLLRLDERTRRSGPGGRQLEFAYKGPPVLEKVSRRKLEFAVHVGIQLWSGTDPEIPLVGSVSYQPLRRTVQFRMAPGAIPPGNPNRSDRLQIPVEPFFQDIPAPAGARVTFDLQESPISPRLPTEPSTPLLQATRLPDELGETLALFREIATARDWKKLAEVMLGPDAVQNDQVRVLQSAAFTVLAASGPERLEDEALLRIATLLIVRNRGTAQLPEGLILKLWQGLKAVLEEFIPGPVPSGLLKDALAGKESALLNLAAIGAFAAFELAGWADLQYQEGFGLRGDAILNLAAQAIQGDPSGRFWNARPFYPPPPSGGVGELLRAMIPPIQLFNGHRERVEAMVRTHLGNLAEADEDLRWTAANGLAALGPDAPEAVPALTGALEDPVADVRRMAARALGSIGYEAAPAKDRLQALAQSDPDRNVQEAARWALSILQSRPAPAEQTLLIDVTLPSQRVSFAEGSLANTLQMAVHDSLLGAVQPHFQGLLAPESWRVISRDPEEAARQLADFTASDQVVRMTVLDKGVLSASQARAILPQSHAPTFLVDEESARQLTPLVAAFLMSLGVPLGVPVEGLYLLELRHDDLSGETRISISA